MVDAHLGYACQAYRANGESPIEIGVVIQPPHGPAAARWRSRLKTVTGSSSLAVTVIGDQRGIRQNSINFSLRCPILPLPSWLSSWSRSVTSRSTGRRAIGVTVTGSPDSWPAGLLAIGDAYCAFNPVFGQGITVAACQALLIRDALKHDSSRAE